MLLNRIKSGISLDDGFTDLVTFVNPFSYNRLRNYESISGFSHVLVDGIAAVFFFRMLGFDVKRYSFDMTSLAPVVFNWAIHNNKSIVFIGGKPGIVEKAVRVFKGKYPDLNIPYYHHGYFDGEKSKELVLKKIASDVSPDVIVVGMGTPLQENILLELVNYGWSGAGFTCGGFFHQTASSGIQYYPPIFDKLNLRWLYRIYDEPKLLKRYLIEYPKFVFLCLKDFYIYKMGKFV